ncbi:hypothetical protein AVEN_10428-1, partial [Araneus ventricosus]
MNSFGKVKNKQDLRSKPDIKFHRSRLGFLSTCSLINITHHTCRLPVEPGPCNEAHPRWFYDVQTQNCLPFVFGGCGGNKNRFKTSEICLRFCTGITATPPERRPYVFQPATSTPEPTQCPPSNCANLQCPYGIEESFDINGCSSCRCSNPCE